jgi:parallel beta-helix repeat protein
MILLMLIPNIKERRFIQMKEMIKDYLHYFKFFLIILLFMFLSGCTGIAPINYTITSTAGTGGSIDPEGAITINEGGNKAFAISPDECYQISDVLVDGISLGPVAAYTFVNVNQNYTIQANFVPGPRVYNTDAGIGYDTIQAAISAAGVGDTIIVCPGTYMENLYFNNEDLIVRSIDPLDPAIVAATVIDGGGNGSVVWFFDDESTLEGFTIRNGNAEKGGGISISYSSPNIENNTIKENKANYGGGIYVYFSSPTIIGNIITNNESKSGGGIHVDASFPTIENNTIESNEVNFSGGGIFMLNSSSTINSNTISSNEANSGGGIYLFSSSSTISGNNITSNKASSNGGGICVNDYSSPTITGNTITDNEANTYGGGIYVSWDDSELLPTTFRPTGWGSSGTSDYQKNIPSGDSIVPAEGVEYTIAGNEFLGNKHGIPLVYSEGAHVYFD